VFPTHSYVLLNGLRFHYLNWGGDGRPVVLLHGLASNARIWDFVAPHLVQAGFRVFAFDQRSHGLTDPPITHAPDDYGFAAVTRDLQAFVETLNLERPLLVGHSWGASTVLSYAATRGGGPFAAAGIVMVDGGLFAMKDVPGFTWDKAEALLRPPDLDGMPVADFRARLRGWLPDGMYSEAVADILLANFRQDEAERLYRRLPIPQHMLIARAIYEKETFDLFARARCPILLCPARETPRDERGAQFLQLKLAGAARAEQTGRDVRTLWFEDTIHDIPLQRPAELAQAICDSRF
jgi:pimeloyl-ACP methyl ester carboxylesterase